MKKLMGHDDDSSEYEAFKEDGKAKKHKDFN
jgi:hypothetical protein